MKQLLDLNPHDCRWPLDNGQFCAERRIRGAYCAEHAERAYIKIPGPLQTGDPLQGCDTPTRYQHRHGQSRA